MRCPYCSNEKSKVTNKRGSPEGIRRRRECLKCKKRYTTYEKVDVCELFVIKKSGETERFDRKKLANGIQKAFEKRPVSQTQIDNAIQEIEAQLRRKQDKAIKASVIGELVLKKIKKLDNIAYIRFSSVYRDFQNVSDFKQALKQV